MHKWKEEELDFLWNYAPGHSHKEIMAALNENFQLELSLGQVKACLERNKIRNGRTGRFEKGHVPANRGKHSGGWEPGWYKKGHLPATHKPVGTVSVRNNRKRGQQCVYEKTAEPNVWKRKCVLEWERQYGPVPKGKIIIAADGNQLNTSAENLVAVTRQQHAVMNRYGIHGYDRESAEAAANVAALKLQIAEGKRRNRK